MAGERDHPLIRVWVQMQGKKALINNKKANTAKKLNN